MEIQDTALPDVGALPTVAGGQEPAPLETQAEAQPEGKEPEQQNGEPPRKEKTPEEREIARLRRRVDNLTRAKYELQARTQGQQVANTPNHSAGQTATQQADDEPLQLSRAELQRLIDQRAQELAPTITQQKAEIEQRRSIVEGLAKDWGQEKFDAYAADLDDALGGLADQDGRPKPAADAIFESDQPRALIEYLADPDHEEEAAKLGRMSAVQAGRYVAKLEAQIAAKKAEAKPQASNAPAPLESARGRAPLNTAPNPADTKAWMKWANEQERKSA